MTAADRSPMSLRALILGGIGGAMLALIAGVAWIGVFGVPALGIDGVLALKRAELIDQIEVVANERQRAIDEWFRERRSDVRGLGIDLASMDLAGGRAAGRGRLLKAILAQVDETSQGAFDSLAVYGSDGQLMAAAGIETTGSAQGALLRSLLVSGVEELVDEIRGDDGRFKLLIARQVPRLDADDEPTGAVAAVVVAVIDAERLFAAASGEWRRQIAAAPLHALLVTPSGEVMAHTGIGGGSRSVRQRAGQGLEAAAIERGDSGEELLAITRHVSLGGGHGLGLGLYLPLAVAMYPAGVQVASIMMLAGLFAIVVFLLGWRFVRRLELALQALRDGVAGLAAGGHVVRVESGIVAAGGRDFVQLADAFNDMASRLDAEHAALIHDSRVRVEALEASEQKYRDLLDSTPDLVTRVGLDGRFVYVNRIAQRIFGLPPEECVGRYAFDFVHPQERASSEQAFAVWRASGAQDFEYENRLVGIDGTVRLCQWNVRLRCGADGQPLDFTSVGRDITDQREHERLLREGEAQHRAVLESAVDGYWRVDAEGRLCEVNAAYAALSGYSREELVGMHIDRIDAVESPEDIAVHIRAIIERGHDRFVSRHRRRDGSLWDVEVSATYHAQSGVFFVFLRDIGDRLRDEQKLVSERQRFIDLVNTTDGIVWEADAQTFTFTFVSGKAERLLGFPVADWLAPGFWVAHLHPDDAEWAPAYCASCTGRLEPHDFEYRFIAQDGRTVWLHDIVTVVGEAGSPRWLRGIMVDITRTKEAEVRVAELQALQRLIVDESPAGLLVYAEDGSCVYANRAAATAVGAPVEELRRQNFRRLDSWKASGLFEMANTVLDSGQACRREVFVRTSAGREAWMDCTMTRLVQSKRPHLALVVEDVTERKHTAQALAESEARLAMSQQVARVGHYVYDFAADSWQSSPVLDEVFGIGPEYPRTLASWLEIVADNDRDELGRYVSESVIPAGAPFDRVYRIRRIDDGELRWVHGMGRIERDAAGQPTSLQGTIQDVTRTKRQERVMATRAHLFAYSESHELQDLLRETLDQVVLLTDSQIGFFHFVDEDQNSLSLQQWSTRTLNEFCRAEGSGLHYPIEEAGVWVDCVRTGAPVIHNDYTALPHRKGLPEGHAPIVRELVAPVLRGSKVVAILGVGNKPVDYHDDDVQAVSWFADLAWDITEHRQSREAVRDSEERFRATFELAAAGMVLCSPEGRFLRVNDRYCQMLGYSRAELLTMTFHDVSHADEAVLDRESMRQLFAGEIPYLAREKRYVRKDGTDLWGALTVSLKRTERGEPEYTIAAVVDITERRLLGAELERHRHRLEELVAERTAQLRQANSELEAFSLTVAHDLRAPLRAIQGFSQALRDECGTMLPEPARTYLDHLMSGSRRLSELIEGLLRLSRAAYAEVVRAPVSLTDLANIHLAKLAQSDSARRVDCEVEPGLLARCDRRWVAAVLGELLDNAWKFTAGSTAARIRVGGCECDGRRGFFVEDNGAGFNMRYADKLFRPFQRLHGEAEFPGVGVGLAIASRLVGRHGGTLSGRATPGEGARFEFTLGD